MFQLRSAFRLVMVVAAFFVVDRAAAVGPALSYPYKVLCTTGMVADIAREVAGDLAKVEALLGEGIDPHLYVATRSDVAKLLSADIVFYNGLLLEGKMGDVFAKVGRKKPVFAVGERLDPELLLTPPEFSGHHDPHVWMDASLWKRCAEIVAQRLALFDADNGEVYMANSRRYAVELDELHAYAREAIQSIPATGRVLVTAHDAFNYMGRAYGIDVVGIQGISTESEAGIADVNRIVSLLVDRRVVAVFVETSVSDKNVRALVEGSAARGHSLKIGGRLFSDAMGKPGTYEGTYIGMIDHNITTITRGLGGTAPARGMNGKLAP